MPQIKIIILFTVIFYSNALAQDSTAQKKIFLSRIDVSYVFAGQIYNDSFIYKPGFSINVTESIMLVDDLGVGIGMGYLSLNHDKFMPIYFEAIGYKRKKGNTSLIKIQAGYSLGWSNAENSLSTYSFKGGAYVNAGFGRNIQINESYSVLFHLSYCHQFAKVKYHIFNGDEYSGTLNYDMLIISFGLIINK